MNLTHVFAPITKSILGDDGVLTVYGKMTGPDLDLDGQICDPTWLKTAVPEWFNTGANVRLMHQPIAIGKGSELEEFGDDYWLSARIVDPHAIKLVDEEVLTGFSIGIKSPKIFKDAAAPNGRIKGGTIVENSLVDRPANPTAKLLLAKMEGGALAYVEELDVEKVEDPTSTAVIAGNVDDAADTAEEAAEVDLVAQARSAITALLAGEVAELAEGSGGRYVCLLLLDMLCDLDAFVWEDQWDDTQAALSEVKAAIKAVITKTVPQEEPVNITTLADLVKAATVGADETEKIAVDELRKALGVTDLEERETALNEKLAASEAKATAAEETAKGLAADLAKVKEMAAPGGPTRIAPQEETTKASARASILAKAAGYRRIADALNDRDLASGYRQLAGDLEASLVNL